MHILESNGDPHQGPTDVVLSNQEACPSSRSPSGPRNNVRATNYEVAVTPCRSSGCRTATRAEEIYNRGEMIHNQAGWLWLQTFLVEGTKHLPSLQSM